MNLEEHFTPEERRVFEEIKKAHWTSKRHQEEGYNKFLQEFFKRNFYCFVWLLGYRDIGYFHVEEIDRLAQVRFIDNVPSRRLWLWSRGFFKTSLITEAHSLWLIVNNPNIRILLVSNTIGISEAILKNIKSHMMTNMLFRKIFPEFCPKENSVGKIEFGTNQDFTVPNRTKTLKEPTMMCAGIGTNLTGRHFDYIKVDDLVTRDSVSNDTQIQASKDYYASLRPLFDNAAIPREDVVGTIYHFNDLYCGFRKTKDFKESFRPVRDVGGNPTFTERLPEEEIIKLEQDPSIGPYQFQTQYMLNPINPADAKFKEEWIKWYDEIDTSRMSQYILCDPASTQKKRSDYTVIQRWGIDDKGNQYLLEGVRDKLTAFQRIDKLFNMVRSSRNLKYVRYEVLGGRHGDLEIISQKQITDKIYFEVKETKSTVQSKADRIEQRLAGLYNAGKIFWPRELFFKSIHDGKVYNFVELMKLEYIQFPFSEHDDILDCQSQIMDERLILGEKEVPRETLREGMTGDEIEKMYKNLDKYTKKYPNIEVRNTVMAANRLRKWARKIK